MPEVDKGESRSRGISGEAGLDTSLLRSEPGVDAAYRALLDATPAMIWVSGPDKGGIYFNQAWREFTGRTLAQELGEGWMETVHPADGAALEVCARAFAHERSFSTELRLRRGDGTYHWMLDRGVPRYDPSGQFLGYVGCAFDISERKAVEAALADADRHRDELVAVLAHELRNPLAAIRGVLDLELRRGSDDPATRRASEVIARQAQQMSRLVDDLLDTARITRGRLELAMQVLELGSLVASLAEDHRAIAEGNGLELVCRVPATPLQLRGDAGRLGQAIGNLLDNAVKFTDSPGTIEIVAGRDETSTMLFVTITDTGSGIAPDELKELFDRPALRRHSRSGLGLGLALVREMAELHGGSLDATSAGSGHGASFTLWLPAAAAHSSRS